MAYDPDKEDKEEGPVAVTTRKTARRAQAVRDEEAEEARRPSRRSKAATAETGAERIEIEVGAQKALFAKYGVVRGATWMFFLSLLLWWVPVLGPAAIGYVGGRKAGSPLRAAIAAAIPITFVFAAVAFMSNTVALVPLVIKHAITDGYNAFLAMLPVKFPILEYVLGNLGAVMSAGPDTLFTVFAFAIVGGLITQMRLVEKSVPPITARLPKHPIIQTPARGYESTNEAVEMLIARLTAVMDRAEGAQKKAGRGRPAAAAAVAQWERPVKPARLPLLARLRRARQGRLEARLEEEGEEIDGSSREVVAAILASTAPASTGRKKGAVKVPKVDLDLPESLAFSKPAAAPPEMRFGPAHQYRPSKLYHIYGPTVNPVSKAKIERRLRRIHTVHALRHGAQALSGLVEVDPEGAKPRVLRVEVPADADPHKPRSLERGALSGDLRYDAMEHLESAVKADPSKAEAAHREEDDLGGLIAHLGEDGEAVAEVGGGEEEELEGGPVFDRYGRQRARIAGEATNPKEERKTPPSHHESKEVSARAKGDIAGAKHGEAADGDKSKAARSADRLEVSPDAKAKIEKWLRHTIAGKEVAATRHSTRAKSIVDEALESEGKERAAREAEKPHGEAKPEAKAKRAEAEEAQEKAAEPAKKKLEPEEAPKTPKRHKTGEAPKFEIMHGSAQADGEAASADGETQPRKLRSAHDILEELKRQKREEEERKSRAEATAAEAKRAKEEADEIERRARAPVAVAMEAEESGEKTEAAGETPTAPAARRRRSRDLEEVESVTEKLDADLELTLGPVRKEDVADHPRTDGSGAAGEIEFASSQEPKVTHAAVPGREIPVGSAPFESTSPFAPLDAPAAPAEEEVERKVKPSDMVLAGPSTDESKFDPREAALSDDEAERISARLKESWNRL